MPRALLPRALLQTLLGASIGLIVIMTSHHSCAEPISLAAHQAHLNQLEERLGVLEQRNTTQSRFLTTGLAIVLDLALELSHAWILQNYAPDYFYNRPLTDVAGFDHFTRNLLGYTLAHGHVPALLAGGAVWASESLFEELPNLPTNNSLLQIGAVAGLLAGSYGVAFHQLMYNGASWQGAIGDKSGLISRLEPSARPWFKAGMRLQSYKNWLQVAAVAILFTSSYLQRKGQKAKIEDVRDALSLARIRLQKSVQSEEGSVEESISEDERPELENILPESLKYQ
ncbi:hypothetical protein [Parendozoicomonas haliclonae]|uniref:Uncharacterized protein n=1 Tax=Parendozoicomonas haliclonae TaxID=1960125 RepID=A0A1X7AET2_9GAMM|nr:hypothetical protein [Parendozoicomonas haliclonae]SMA33723.1 hypothetical protein EHSB41UT_00324 [Parendozoicomonas haliclonae]